jgi:DNA-binding beta-propeller fold protein YncE
MSSQVSRRRRLDSAAVVLLALMLGGCGGSMMTTNTTQTTAPVPQNASFAFVANTNSNTVSAFLADASSGELVPVAGGPFSTDDGPEYLAVDPASKFLFVGNAGSNTVSAFHIDAGSGKLTSVPGSPFVSGARPEGVAVDPTGRFVFVANQASSSISVFSIGANGALVPAAGSPFAASSPFELAINPSGGVLFASNFPDSTVSDLNTVSAFQIGANGALTAVPGSPFATANAPGFASSVGLVTDPGGKFLFVADHMAQAVVPFNINASNGMLTQASALPTPPASCGVSCHNNPLRVTVHPNGQLVYATNVQAGTVSVFGLVSGGLSPIAEFPTGQHPFGVALDPKGNFLYVVNKVDNNISVFSVSMATGSLSPVSGSPFPAGGNGPIGIVIVPKP